VVRRVIVILLCLAHLLALSSCGKTASPVSLTQETDSLTATLAVFPYPPVPMRDATLELTLHDAGGQPVSGAKVRFDLTMPSCVSMPPNRPEATEDEPSVYRAQTIFTMAGAWQIDAEVSLAGVSEQLTFYLATK
jgi:hypothetical protein